ncbi:hypothetical protein BABINDRAFT_164627 [Babjeviella inositovora NRRL Y-12698]|uniref:Uncharacterized protein n=1 Tax=Babjeviella inositovora NRRL Y-12698 TaxID=984486 RepID=A0A1E3QZ05_9ASCO|nr:uncharacterized protein BABINDRAFT_164627 [Babjeviella inositovora NRRL Y-12698]ODQ82900.1 hypothetical protein BABINDRAFT_164627 [Babjeviella inositovora NRRL Y-12698]
MGIFRAKSKQNSIGKDDKLVIHTANVHDPILSAVQEAEPFEQAADTSGNRRSSYQQFNASEGEMRDIFGYPITQPDYSNPTRSRNERPLDTIRGFEYAITGDLRIRDQLETPLLGWGFHEDFPQHGKSYVNEVASEAPYQFNNYTQEQPIYRAPVEVQPVGKKKKGWFGRKR